MSIQVIADNSLADHILAMLREDNKSHDTERGDSVHVSDLVFPRRTWLGAHHPKPLTDFDLLYFTAGRAHHEIIEKLINKQEMREVKLDYRGIVGTVDALAADGTPVEVKSTRVKTPYVPSNVPDNFVTQLGMYSAMMNPEEQAGSGTILLFYLGIKEEVNGVWRNIPHLQSFRIDFTDLPKIRATMLYRKHLLTLDTIPSTETCSRGLCRVCKWHKAECDGWGSDLDYRVRESLQKQRSIWIASH